MQKCYLINTDYFSIFVNIDFDSNAVSLSRKLTLIAVMLEVQLSVLSPNSILFYIKGNSFGLQEMLPFNHLSFNFKMYNTMAPVASRYCPLRRRLL